MKRKPVSILLFQEDWQGPLGFFPSAVEYGALHRLAHISLSAEPPCELPNDDSSLAAMAGVPESDWGRIKQRIASFMRVDGSVVRFDWMRQRLEERRKYLNQQAAKGKWPRPPNTVPTQLEHSTNKDSTNDQPNLNLSSYVPVPDGKEQQQEKQPTRAREKPPSIDWTEPGGWSGIQPHHRSAWASAYPACDIDLCLSQMSAWLIANPKQKKHNYARFVTNWLKGQQDKGGNQARGEPPLFQRYAKPVPQTWQDRAAEIRAARLAEEAKKNGVHR